MILKEGLTLISHKVSLLMDVVGFKEGVMRANLPSILGDGEAALAYLRPFVVGGCA